MKYYKIYYEVDTGWDYHKDTAIVRADDEGSAVKKLKSYIENIDNEYIVSEVFYVKELVEEIFTPQFRNKGRVR